MYAQGMNTEFGGSDLRVHWWVQYEVAARKIQRAFRSWNIARQFRRNYSRKLKMALSSFMYLPTLEDSFRNIVAEACTFENKACLWRAAVELRRAHKIHNTDLIMRSLIDSAGDQSRSVVLLGTKDYSLLNKADIPNKLRKMFLPTLEMRTEVDPYRKLLATSLRKLPGNETMAGDDTSYSAVRQNNVNIIRSLRGIKGKQIVYEKSREQQRAELFSILNSVVERSFFSRNHFGSKDHKKSQKVPQTATVVSRGWLDRQREEMLAPSMDSLIAKPGILRGSV